MKSILFCAQCSKFPSFFQDLCDPRLARLGLQGGDLGHGGRGRRRRKRFCVPAVAYLAGKLAETLVL